MQVASIKMLSDLIFFILENVELNIPNSNWGSTCWGCGLKWFMADHRRNCLFACVAYARNRVMSVGLPDLILLRSGIAKSGWRRKCMVGLRTQVEQIWLSPAHMNTMTMLMKLAHEFARNALTDIGEIHKRFLQHHVLYTNLFTSWTIFWYVS